MQLQGMASHKNLGSAGSRTAQLRDPDHLFYIAQKNVHVKNMKTENHIMPLYLLKVQSSLMNDFMHGFMSTEN